MIDQALMTSVMAVMEERPDDSTETLLQVLREKFPGIHFSLCSDDDVPPKLSPAAECKYCCLYYVDSGGHCLRLTNDPEAATGLVVALREWD